MNAPDPEFGATARKLVGLQVGVALAVALAFGVSGEMMSALPALYGGMISIITALLLSRGVRRAGEKATQSAKSSMLILYLGAAQRFVLIAALFAMGLALLGLEPLPMVAGFIATQLSYLFSMRGMVHKKN